MLCAIVYTGEVRTLNSVIDTFKKHVLLDENKHVFGVLQSSNKEFYDKLVKDKMGNNLKSLQWFEHNDTWTSLRDRLIDNMGLTLPWKQYIAYNSGSMVEYYQMYLAYKEIEKYEMNHGIKYDFIYRIRCDCIITRPINYQFTQNKEEVNNMCDMIEKIHGKENVLNVFMTSLCDPDRLMVTKERSYINFMPTNINDVYEFLHSGEYLVTFRHNVFYFGPRRVFEKIYKLGVTYGEWYKPDDYWFNSESQLRLICELQGINVYDTCLTMEAKSLYEYNVNNYYKDNELINNDVFFFLKRQ